MDVYEVLRKCRSNGEQEIFVTVDEIEFLTGVGESKSKSILFYLERHTRVNGKSLLERGENAQTKWLLAFEHGYEDRIQDPAINASSLQLIDQFLTSDEFRLREREIRVIDGDDHGSFAKIAGKSRRSFRSMAAASAPASSA